MLTQESLKEWLRYDPETGVFTRAKDTYRRKYKAGEIAGTLHSDGCIHIGIEGKYYKAHRLAFLYMDGEFPEKGVDHRDGNRSNNIWSNIRPANQSENNQNHSLRKDSTSGHVGVSYAKDRDRWEAKIGLNGKTIHLGRHKTREAAIEAYKSAKNKYHSFNPEIRV